MIQSFACADTEALFHSHPVRRFKNLERIARRKLLALHAATELESLRVPPGNRLEVLLGYREGQHSIRLTTSGVCVLSGKTTGLIPFSFRCEIRREAADSAVARQGEATTYRIEMEMELQRRNSGLPLKGNKVWLKNYSMKFIPVKF